MDPEATLNAAQANLAAGKKASGWRALEWFDRAGQRLEDYWAWRRRGGFEPPKGDRRAGDIAEELSDAWEKESDRVAEDRAAHADYWENNPNTGITLSVEDFDSLSPKDRVFIKTSGGFSAGEREFEVGRKSYSKKYKVESKRLYPIKDGKPVKKGVAKWTLYKRDDGRVSLAHGDMGTIIHAFRRATESNPNAKVVFLAKQGKVTVSVQQVGRNEYLVSAKEGPHAIGGGPLTKKKAREWVENTTANVSANTGKDWYVVRNDIDAHVERKSLRSRANNPGTPPTTATDLVRRLKF